jgi:hypothetical protein
MKVGALEYGSNGESKAFTRNREAEYFALSTEDLYFPALFRIIYTEIITISEISLKVYIHTDVYFNVRNLGTYKKNDPLRAYNGPTRKCDLGQTRSREKKDLS